MANIRWRKKDYNKLINYIRKFNTSLTKYGNKYPELRDSGILPERLDREDVISHIYTRKDFNKWIKRIDRWFKKGARDIIRLPSGIQTTRWAYKEAQYAARSVNKYRAKLAEHIELPPEKEEEYRAGKIDVDRVIEKAKRRLQDSSRNNFDTLENEVNEWNMFVSQLFWEASSEYITQRDKQYMLNYYQALDRNLTKDQADEIKKRIEDLGLSGFQLFLITAYNDRADIPFIYGAEEQAVRYEDVLENIKLTYEELSNIGIFK